MKLSDLAIRNRATVAVLTVVILLFGAYSYLTLPREAAPDIQIPFISVVTPYEGASPVDVENTVTSQLEKKFQGLDGLKKMTSNSVEGLSVINLEFLPDVDIDTAMQKVRDKIDQAKGDIAKDAEESQLIEINFSDFPILIMNLSGDIGLVGLKKIAEDLEEALEAIPGVLDVNIVGGLERVIVVEFDVQRLAAYGLSLPQLYRMIEEENVNVSGGSMKLGEGKYLLRVPREFKTPEAFMEMVLATQGGKPIYLRDVATVIDGFKDVETYSRLDGRACVTLTLQKRSGENIIRIVEHAKAILAEVQKRLPPDVKVAITLDQSNVIRMMVADLENNIASGFILVVGVLMLVMGLRNALFVAVAIPLSMLLSFTVLHAMQITLNMVVLFSLILALGMLVDNAIVIVENIYRHRQEGQGAVAAARIATAEVAWPVTTSTLTTVAAFVPMLFWPGIVGEFMKYLPITLIVTLSASLFVALVINPVLCSVFMKVRGVRPAPEPGQDPWAQRRPGRFMRAYEAFLRLALRHRGATIGLAVGVLAAVTWLYGLWGGGVEFFPDADPTNAYINVTMAEGTRLETTDAVVRQIEEQIAQAHYPNLQYMIANVGAHAGREFMLMEGSSSSHTAAITLVFKDYKDRPVPSAATVDDIRRRLRAMPGVELEIKKEEHGPPVGAPISVEIQGDDFDVLNDVAHQAKEIMSGIAGIVDLRDDYLQGQPELRVMTDRHRVALLGLTSNFVGEILKTAVYGRKVGVFRETNDEYDVRVRLPEKDRDALQTIHNLMIPLGDGVVVPLASVATVEYSSGLAAVRRINQKRTITVKANVVGRQTNDALAEVQAKLRRLTLPPGVRIDYTGEKEEQDKAAAFLSKAFVVAILLIALVLISEFNSVVLPIIILISVVLSLIGVFIGLMVTRLPFGIIMTGIGVISLAGVVVNNAIVLLDYTEQLRRRGLDHLEAVVRAGCVRLRPVFLTAITTVLGLIPMATGVGFDFQTGTFETRSESSEWWGPMAVAVIFGLSVATVLTLVVVPTLYSLFQSLRARLARFLPKPENEQEPSGVAPAHL